MLRLTLEGELDWAVVGHVEGALAKARRGRVEHVVLDLSALTFLDLAGLRVVLRAHAMPDFRVTVVRPRGPARRVFAFARAGEQLDLVNEA